MDCGPEEGDVPSLENGIQVPSVSGGEHQLPEHMTSFASEIGGMDPSSLLEYMESLQETDVFNECAGAADSEARTNCYDYPGVPGFDRAMSTPALGSSVPMQDCSPGMPPPSKSVGAPLYFEVPCNDDDLKDADTIEILKLLQQSMLQPVPRQSSAQGISSEAVEYPEVPNTGIDFDHSTESRSQQSSPPFVHTLSLPLEAIQNSPPSIVSTMTESTNGPPPSDLKGGLDEFGMDGDYITATSPTLKGMLKIPTFPSIYGTRTPRRPRTGNEPVEHEISTPGVQSSVVQTVPPRRHDGMVQCTHCSLKFRQTGNLRKHIAEIHEKKKPFACSVCNVAFSRKHARDTHFRAV